MSLLRHLMRHSGGRLLIATLAGLIGGLSGAGLVTLIGRGITATSGLGTIAVSFFALCAITLASRIVSENLLLRCTQDMVLRVRLALSRRLIETPQRRLQEIGKPELVVILTQDVDSFAMVARTLPRAFGDVIVIAACFAYLAWLSPILCGIFVAYMAVGVVVTQLAERAPLRGLRAARAQVDALHQHFRGLVDGSRELQLNAPRARMFVDEIIAPTARQFRVTLIRAMRGYNAVANTGSVLFYLAVGMTEFLLPRWIPISHDAQLHSMVVLLYLVQPLTELIALLPLIGQARVAYDRICQLDAQLGDALQPLSGADPFATVTGEAARIALHGVRYRYGSDGADAQDGFRFGPVDLTIEPGEIAFIVGGNGSGKTTLAMLLLGLVEPDAGHLSFGGVAVTGENLAQYRARFSAIFYDFHLFEHLLGDDDGHALERARHYIDDLGLTGKVTLDGHRFSSTTALSSGQRRRLALVSAYLEDRPVYLFDEWAADQDPEFRKVFYSRLLPDLKRRGKTVLVVTHDDRYFGEADRLIHLEYGRVAGVSVCGEGTEPAAAAACAASTAEPEAERV